MVPDRGPCCIKNAPRERGRRNDCFKRNLPGLTGAVAVSYAYSIRRGVNVVAPSDEMPYPETESYCWYVFPYATFTYHAPLSTLSQKPSQYELFVSGSMESRVTMSQAWKVSMMRKSMKSL